MCVTDRHDMTFAVKVALNADIPNHEVALIGEVGKKTWRYMLWRGRENLFVLTTIYCIFCFLFQLPYLILYNKKLICLYFNISVNKPLVLCVCSTRRLKTLWEKKKLLITSNFSFSNSVFYPFGELSAILIKLKIVVCKRYQFWKVWICCFGKF